MAVLGPVSSVDRPQAVPVAPAVTPAVAPAPASVPVHQAVQSQMQWPGSGELSVRVVTDGPTRVLQVTDAQARPAFARLERDWVIVAENHASKLVAADGSAEQKPCPMDLTVSLKLPAGIGLSAVSSAPPAELVYVCLGDISAEYRRSSGREALDGSVRLLQVDCQLTDTAAPCALHVTPGAAGDERRHLPAVCFAAQRLPSLSPRSQIFEHLMVSVKDLTLTIEERLLYHLLNFIGYTRDSSEVDQLEESDLETQRALKAATSSQNTRYYFRRLELALKKLRLSVLTSARLPPELAAARDKFGRRLVQFESAQVELDPFVRNHPFETGAKLLDSVLEHYQAELKGQAAIILGSIDFLGNPLGFYYDFREGVSGLVMDGDVGGLVKSVTHGVANSTAKVTGSLSEAVGWTTLDEKHDDKRSRIRALPVTRSEGHLMAGLEGFKLGLWGGASSLVVQPIKGASTEGVWGFFSGIGKGIVGTVTKPALGILDLAAGAANAVRDTSSSSSRQAPPRVRLIRVVQGPGGLLPRYSSKDGYGQDLLLAAADCAPDERYVAYELLCSGEYQQAASRDAGVPELLSYGPSDLRVLISTQVVRVLSHSSPDTFHCSRTVHFSELVECRPQIEREPGGAHLYQVVMTVADGGAAGPRNAKVSQPALRCQNADIAVKITELINFGKSCYDELAHTVPPKPTPSEFE